MQRRPRTTAARRPGTALVRLIGAAGAVALAALAGCAQLAPAGERDAPPEQYVIVAVDDVLDAAPSAGGTPRADERTPSGYAGGVGAAALADAVAQTHALQEQSHWTIASLRLRCSLFRIAPGADRAAVLAALARDRRVQLAQPLNRFETLANEAPAPLAPPAPLARPVAFGGGTATVPYNDPYLQLQRGFIAMDAAAAQRWSRGEGVRVALIDSGVDAAHPDLAGQLLSQRDFTGTAAAPAPGGERHGTEMAGVIAALANNGLGIAGMAPNARLLAFRACWSAEGGSVSRCDSFTLARALGAAIAADAAIINLSLGGPADPLLERLARHAISRGVIVVGAVPASGQRGGFPTGVPGVLAVGSAGSGAAPAPGVLVGPGSDILTLTPGGHYDYASGSSLAAAHVTGVLALLRALDPALPAEVAQAWLARGPLPADACAAVQHLRPAAECGAALAARR